MENISPCSEKESKQDKKESDETKNKFGEWKVEDWYEHIKELTFETYFIDLKMKDALAIQFAYEFHKKGESSKFKDEHKILIENVCSSFALNQS
jgi:hypothetical protein